jgi:AcrR family transcriptional regulator
VAAKRPGEQPVPRITPGVFFGAPVALPRGPHALPRADVLAEQRERLMAAMTELIAAGGYAGVTIGALASRSTVSRTAFYECFAGKEACAFAAYDRFIESLLTALAQRVGQPVDPETLIPAMLDGYFATLEQDLVVTRAFLVEFDALGFQARERRRAALRGIAAYLREMHGQAHAADGSISPPFADDVYVGITYMARQLACDALDEHPRPDLRAIGETLGPWLQTVYRPGAQASRVRDGAPASARAARASG